MPDLFSNTGRRWRNSPDCSVEVVEATVMKRVCAMDAGHADKIIASDIKTLCTMLGKLVTQEPRRLRRGGLAEESIGVRALYQPPLAEKQDFVSQAPGLAEIVS